MIEINKENCTGCSACVSACPKNIISMTEGEYGFVYPKVNEGCINCGKCLKACPINKNFFNKKQDKVFCYQNSNYNELKSSSSGGAFYTIAKKILENKGIVYGCAYYNYSPLEIKHIRVDKIDDLPQLQGSKYVQSDTVDIYEQVKKDLNNNLTVLFSGTPCQIAGLKSFLGTDYNNLVTIDLICHGVPSQKALKKYINLLEKQNNGILTKFNFRDINYNGSYFRGKAEITNNCSIFNKKQSIIKIKPSSSWYYMAFLYGHIYRHKCYSCDYAKEQRVGDITIGDFWGIENYKNKTNKLGYSLIIANTEKAFELLNEQNMLIESYDFEKAKSFNKQLYMPSDTLPQYDILEAIDNKSPEEIKNIYRKRNRNLIFKEMLKEKIPECCKNLIRKLIKYV